MPHRYAATLAPLAVALAALAAPHHACAARASDAIERSIEFSGPAATTVAGLLGMATDRASSLTLRLGGPMAWAIYLLKQDTPVHLDNDNNGSPPRDETITFAPDPVPMLTMSPYWLDFNTSLPSPEANTYAFSSPFLPQDLTGTDAWTGIAKRLRASPQWKATGWTAIDRCESAADTTQLCISVMRRDDYPNNVKTAGYIVMVRVRLPAA
jgi:hypothetical protein